MSQLKRRNFLKLSGLSALPFLTTTNPTQAFAPSEKITSHDAEAVYFINDGIFYRPIDFLEKLQEVNADEAIERDSYAGDGTMKKLLQKFMDITGKEAAIFMPSGTLANQLAISVLSGSKTKAMVQETSHVYRDEGDAAQTHFNKRLIPLATGKPYFKLEELQQAITYHQEAEAFEAGIGVISIETPVRRCDNRIFPVEEIKNISAYCREKGYKMHLDGARLHVASTFTGTSVKEYASYFDTVYMCLYKYLGATGGAVLCGDKNTIEKMHHLVKIHGGGIFTNWPSAAMALHHLQDIDDVMAKVKIKSQTLLTLLNQINGIKIRSIEGGSNIVLAKLGDQIDSVKLGARLRAEHNIIFGQPRKVDGYVMMKINPTLLRRDNKLIYESFREAVKNAVK